jgi:hypothetical protein
LRISEARDLGEFDRYAFYDHMKTISAAPPDVLRINEKNLREYYIPNLCAPIITSNHKTDGLFLPADDRRTLAAWSPRTNTDFAADYWRELYRYYNSGGDAHVAEYLASIDLSEFDPKAPPPKTAAFWEIVDANRAPEEGELADAIDTLANLQHSTAALTIEQITSHASSSLGESPQFPPHPLRPRSRRLRRRAQRRRQRRPVESQRPPASGLRQSRPLPARPNRRRPQAVSRNQWSVESVKSVIPLIPLVTSSLPRARCLREKSGGY